MATLTNTAYYVRRIIKYGAITILSFIIIKGVINAGMGYWRKLRPAPPPAPTVSFGKLPKIKFPASKFSGENLVYRLETVVGGLPDLGDQGKVYLMPIMPASLLNLERAKNQAQRMGFFGEPQKIDETVYQWQNFQPLLTTLIMDIINGQLTIKKNWQEDQMLLMEKMLPVKQQAITEAKGFFQKNGLMTLDLELGEPKVSYFRFTPPNLLSAISLSEADLARVDLFRKKLDDFPLLTPNPENALVSILISGSRETGKRILEAYYIHFPIQEEIFATYPLKSTSHAWQELKSNQAFVANLGANSNQEIIIRQVYLAFFESSLPQNYLQPVYVFEGSNNFVGYVTAISSEWTE